MIQFKLVEGKDIATLNNHVNEFLSQIGSEAHKGTQFDFMAMVAAIEYEMVEEWKDHLCCDCQYWDDGGEMTTSGICHETGQRRRFNNPSCKCFKDVRR